MESKIPTLHIPSTAQPLPSTWEWRRLDSVCEGIFDCPHSTPKLTEEGPFIARSQDIRTGIFRVEEAGRVSEETFHERINRVKPRYGDLLYSREGTYFGIAAEVPLGIRVCLGQRMVLLRPDEAIIDHRFLLYWINSPTMVLHVYGHRDGTVAERLNLSTIRGLPVAVPPLPVQKAIVKILGSLDDKIELNRQMNETLEAMARAIFKSWFVDFNPVRAKAEGRQPTGMDAETAALFPDSIEEVDGREVPRGWGVEALGNVTDMTKGRSYTSDELQESTTALVTLKSFQRGGGYRQDGLKPFVGDYKPDQIIQPGELVISFTDVTQAAEVIGKPALVSANPDYQLLVASLDVGIIRPKDERVNVPFLYLLLRNDEYQSHIYGYCSGTTVLHLDKSGVPKFEFICPNIRIMRQFFKITKPIFNEIENNIQQSRTLAKIRDALLPKLMSGELMPKIINSKNKGL